jgi:hypothetical protein
MPTHRDRTGPCGVGSYLALALLLSLLTGTGCARTLRGRVLDAATGQPIAGAVILGVWTKTYGLGEHHTTLAGTREVPAEIRVAPFPPGGSHWEHGDCILLATSSTISQVGWVKFREAFQREEGMR